MEYLRMVWSGIAGRTAIWSTASAGKGDEAKDLYVETVGKGLKAEAQCFFTLVYYLCQLKDFEGALSGCDDCIPSVGSATYDHEHACASTDLHRQGWWGHANCWTAREQIRQMPKFGIKLKWKCQRKQRINAFYNHLVPPSFAFFSYYHSAFAVFYFV